MNHEDDDAYLAALVVLNQDGLTEKKWLVAHFSLYKTTLNWPSDLPPISRSDLIDRSLRKKFHETYAAILSEHMYYLDNETKSFELF